MSIKEPTVYVLQDTGQNFGPAQKYGKLTTLLPSRLNITMSPQPVLRELRISLRNFSDADHLLLVGDPVAMGLALYIAATENSGRVNILKWDRIMREYIQIKVDLYDRPEAKYTGEHNA